MLLRAEQNEFIENLRAALREDGVKRIMAQAPTGYGKTKVSAAIVRNVIERDKRAIFTVPSLSLIDQTVKMFWDEGISDIGVIQGEHEMTNWSRPVQVCSVQTLMRRTPPPADLSMVDEAHRWFEFYGKWMLSEEWRGKPFIGLSATPWTRGLGRYYQRLIIAATTQEMIDAGNLSTFKVYVPTHPDLTGVRTVAGDYHEGQLSGAMNKDKLVADIVQTWMQLAWKRPTICFAVDRLHAKSIQKQFQAAGVSTDYIDMHTSRNEREAIRGRFHGGQCDVVVNVECLTTGVDWDVRCIILARPTKSEILFTQMIGRGLRTAEGKDYCLILDHSDTHLRFGYVTDIHHDELDMGVERLAKKERKIAMPKECPECHYLKPPRTPVCPACGFAVSAHSRIENEEGELAEFKGKKKKAEPTIEEKARFYAQLKWVAAEKRYKTGWAAAKFKDKFHVWPGGSTINNVMPEPPEPSTLSWITSRNIAYAKRRHPAHAGH